MSAAKAVMLVVLQLILIYDVCHDFTITISKSFDNVGREGDWSVVLG